MILPGFLVMNGNGLYCPFGDFYLDPVRPCVNALISHAHGDHAVKGNHNVHCTAATSAIMQHRYKRDAGKNLYVHDFGEQFVLNGVKITFFPAGHILGSAQILMEYEGRTYLYTGDFKLQEDATCERMEFVQADVLITETTFADPEVKHPDPVGEISKLNGISHHVLLGSYSLGKAQRLSRLISDHCPGHTVVLHHSIYPLNKIYDLFGYSTGNYELYNRKVMKQFERNIVYIVPPLTFDSYIRAKNVVRAFASGWERLQVKDGLRLMISDHADWEDILYLTVQVKPREIWTLHGDGRHLKEHFKGQVPVKLLNVC